MTGPGRGWRRGCLSGSFCWPLEVGKASGGRVGGGKALTPLLGLPCGSVGGVVLPVSPDLSLCKAFRSFGLSGAGGLCSCATAWLLEGIFLFPTARPFGWLCLRAWLLVAALGSFPLETVFCFSGGVVAAAGSWSPWGVLVGGAAADSCARFFI